MDNYRIVSAAKCLEQLRLKVSPNEFGYRVQGLAAQVLLRLGYRISSINQSGHPDIAAIKDGREFYFEVEAEVGRPRLRQLSDDDLGSLTGVRNVVGYYALAISFPAPYWVLVPALKLIDRPPISNILFEALSDKEYSAAWTREYVKLLEGACTRIGLASFGDLRQMALNGRGILGG